MATSTTFRYTTSPIIIILGATAVGKTKLSVHLSKRFNGEIINADSMQIYEGLDIATAKPTVEEKENVPHHLFSYVNSLDRSHTVVDYRNDALPVVSRSQNRGDHHRWLNWTERVEVSPRICSLMMHVNSIDCLRLDRISLVSISSSIHCRWHKLLHRIFALPLEPSGFSRQERCSDEIKFSFAARSVRWNASETNLGSTSWTADENRQTDKYSTASQRGAQNPKVWFDMLRLWYLYHSSSLFCRKIVRGKS